MGTVWVVDDDQSIRWVLERALLRDGFEVRTFESAADCLGALETGEPGALVSDIRMPGSNGIELLREVKTHHPGLPVIIMTAFSDLDSAVSAFQGGAFEYLPKPFDVGAAVELIRRAVRENDASHATDEPVAAGIDMLGQAPAMQEVFRAIGRLSQSAVTVLITGESGTGKELVARALHDHSQRAQQAFVALNTAAIPRDLLESELFGHERGAFTGAQQTRRGRFEQAEGGTLFLDEIGDMPAELQTRLLRVLSDGSFYRVGGHAPIKANVRVIAATHQNLEERVRQGGFREDLFHRLNVIRLRLPPLRERVEDIALLARHFMQKSAQELGVEAKRLSPDALARMAAFAWPGNVRQLQNVCHWLSVMAPSQVIEAKDLPAEIVTDPSLAGGVPHSLVASVAASAAPPVTAAPGGAPSHAFSVPVAVPSVASTQPAIAAHGEVHLHETAGETASAWSDLLAREVDRLLAAQPPDERGAGSSILMEQLSRQFEGTVIRCALRATRGRRIDAAQRLGIGRNTITRKIQELRLDDD
ncbi:MAG: nitrogen regulation protein NR(I) [Burkholderiaceae bacterium]|nr:nitrogen regulation protein NR(I) [Burkholderiaceae bacterium]